MTSTDPRVSDSHLISTDPRVSETHLISTDPALLDLDVIHGFLSTCYWSPGIARERIAHAIQNSLCFGVYDTTLPFRRAQEGPAHRLPAQVGFARIVTDRATFAYLCDVFIIESHRKMGLSKRLMDAVMAHPDLRGVRRLCLFTRDAHSLYTRYGFTPMPEPARYLERLDKEIYKHP